MTKDKNLRGVGFGKKRFACIFFTLLIVLTASASAAAVDVTYEQARTLGVGEVENALSGDARELLGDTSVLSPEGFGGGLERIFGGVAARLREILSGAFKSALIIVMAAAFSGIFSAAFPSGNGNYAALAGVMAVSAVSLGSVSVFIGLGTRVIDELSTFSKTLLPCLSAAAAAGGALTSASAKYAATALFLDILSTLMRSVILPLIYAFCAVTIAEAAIGGDALSGASSLIKWLIKSLLSVFVVLFILYMAVSGVISSAADAVSIRAAKVTISTVLPVVGSILADAADTVLSGAKMLRNAVGVFGVLSVIAICAVPFVRIGVNYLFFKAAAGISGSIAEARVTKLINAFGTAFGMLLALAGINAVTLFVSIISVITAVN